MLGDRPRWAGQIKADSEIGQCRKFERNGVADNQRAGRNRDRRLTVKGYGLPRAAHDRRTLEGLGNLSRANHQGSVAVEIGETDPNHLSADGYMDNLAQG